MSSGGHPGATRASWEGGPPHPWGWREDHSQVAAGGGTQAGKAVKPGVILPPEERGVWTQSLHTICPR